MPFLHKKIRFKKQKALGAFIGLAAGDRIGGPIEMALALSASLIKNKGFITKEVANAYVEWWDNGGIDAGITTRTSLDIIKTKKSLDSASSITNTLLNNKTAGCNPTHRIVPLALFSVVNDTDLPILALKEATITHFNPLAGDVSASVCVLIRGLIRGENWKKAKYQASLNRTKEVKKALNTTLKKNITNSGFSPDVLAAAIWHIENYNSFDEALDASILFAGPANYCPVLVGTLGGAKWTASQIGDFWVSSSMQKKITEQANLLT